MKNIEFDKLTPVEHAIRDWLEVYAAKHSVYVSSNYRMLSVLIQSITELYQDDIEEHKLYGLWVNLRRLLDEEKDIMMEEDDEFYMSRLTARDRLIERIINDVVDLYIINEMLNYTMK